MNSLNILFLALLLSVTMVEVLSKGEWSKFKMKYKKKFKTIEDEAERKCTFDTKRKMIERHNKMYELGLVSFKVALNQFSDKNESVLNKRLNGARTDGKARTGLPMGFTGDLENRAPARRDWREKGIVTSVKDQLKCAACYVFAARTPWKAKP